MSNADRTPVVIVDGRISGLRGTHINQEPLKPWNFRSRDNEGLVLNLCAGAGNDKLFVFESFYEISNKCE